MLEKIGTKTATTPRVKSRFVLKAKVAVLEMHANMNNYEIYDILADIPKGERNQYPTESQYSIPCPPFGLANCTKTLCVARKSWDIRPQNSDGTINQIYVNWSNHFKGLYDIKKIPHLVLKMTYNHFCIYIITIY